jgi:hypothetical protein
MTERRIARWLAAVAFFGLALWALHDSLRDYRYGDIAAAFGELPSARLALAIATCGSPIPVPDGSGRQSSSTGPAGQGVDQALAQLRARAGGVIVVAYIPNCDMQSVATILAGVDVWLNTPLPPLEASGTSGMKAAFNGVPQLSVLDG